MAFDLSFGSLSSARERLANLSEPTTKKILIGASVAATQASAFGFAWLESHYKGQTLAAPMGVPISVLAGLALSGVSLLDLAGEYDPVIGGAGAGALAVYFASLGASMGAPTTAANATAAAQIAATPATTATKGLRQGMPQTAWQQPARQNARW